MQFEYKKEIIRSFILTIHYRNFFILKKLYIKIFIKKQFSKFYVDQFKNFTFRSHQFRCEFKRVPF